MRAAIAVILGLSACTDAKSTPDSAPPTDTAEATPDTLDDATEPPPDTAPEADVAAIEPWRHEGPITTDSALDITPNAPLFVDRSAVLPAIPMPEGRAMVVDFDGDDREDIVVLNATTPVFLRNTTTDGVWSFEDFTAEAGMTTNMVLLVFGDIDNDGDVDAFSGTSFRSGRDGVSGIWLNDGAGHFSYLGRAGLTSNKYNGQYWKEMSAATFADFDRDGVLDLYITTWDVGTLSGSTAQPSDDELYKGAGNGEFAQFPLPEQHNPLTSQVDPSLAGVPRRGYGLCPADFDDDGDIDLFVNNYGAGRPAADSPPLYWDWNFLWRNDGNMAFVDVGVEAQVAATTRGIGGVQEETPLVFNGTTYPGPIGGNGFGCSWGDFDNDGDLDLVVGQIAHPDYKQSDRLMLHVNPGGAAGSPRIFGEESAERGLQYYEDELHPVLVDIDLDGRLDLAVSRLRGGSKWEVYLQGEDQNFTMRTQADSGVDIERPGPTVWLDVDGDGDLDFFMPFSATGRIFENVAAKAHSLTLDLIGAGTSPRDATGARVTAETSIGKHMRELIGGTGHYNSQQTRRVHIGLGRDSGAHAVTVRWPDGEVQVLGDIKAGTHLELTQGSEIYMR